MAGVEQQAAGIFPTPLTSFNYNQKTRRCSVCSSRRPQRVAFVFLRRGYRSPPGICFAVVGPGRQVQAICCHISAGPCL